MSACALGYNLKGLYQSWMSTSYMEQQTKASGHVFTHQSFYIAIADDINFTID